MAPGSMQGGSQERLEGWALGLRIGDRTQMDEEESVNTEHPPGTGVQHLCECARVAIAKRHRLAGFNSSLFSHSPGAWRVVSSEASVLGL